MFRGLVDGFALLIAGTPAMAACKSPDKYTSECGPLGTTDFGCHFEANSGKYKIESLENGNQFHITKICEKYPEQDYCSCRDYGIY